jgi:hypothetical protein
MASHQGIRCNRAALRRLLGIPFLLIDPFVFAFVFATDPFVFGVTVDFIFFPWKKSKKKERNGRNLVAAVAEEEFQRWT